ncbi:MAG: hypothetical protein KDI15_01895 [Thiothrix sp.]|nr:hypothetical protein [Thiothrix sp.]HPE59233.1 YiiX/YebB-like N1pC/P60 family cysteine hydrolase [Thiolinea sp.]
MFKQAAGNFLANYLSAPDKRDVRPATCSPETLLATIEKGDILLVEGSSRFSTAIKYLTQSTWSHAALCIGKNATGAELIEADVSEGVRIVPLHTYGKLHTRICRPVGLNAAEIDQVVEFARARLNHRYDLRNVFDLMRYLIRTPPVPRQWRRRMLALGSGDPTRAICSTLIAQAYQSVQYPILPDIEVIRAHDNRSHDSCREILHIRHYSLFAPRDFDISPYFAIIKPTLAQHFDFHKLHWAEPEMTDSDKADVDDTLMPGAPPLPQTRSQSSS